MPLIVEREITEQMDKLVQERVAECLKTHIPQELQDEVARSKLELKQVRIALHNSCVGLICRLQLIILIPQNLLGRAVEPTQISNELLVTKKMTGRRPRLRPFI
jgi:hypothetical protein